MRNSLLRPDSAKKNFVFQFIYQVVVLVIPMITSPYLTRTLGGTSLGIYSYTYSIAYYFVIFAMLGIEKHGQRIISQRRDDITKLRRTFWSLYAVHAFASVLALLAYVIYVFAICSSDVNVAWAQTVYVATALIDLTWLFFGLEKFKMVTVRNFIIRIVNTVCIFLFIKSPSDLLLYTVLMAVAGCAGQLVLFPRVIAEIPPIKFSKEDLKEHIKPLLTLFVAVIAVTLYTVFDKTLLGLMVSKESVAYYEYSDKIINIPKTFIKIISTVLFPKACQYAAVKNYDKMRRNFEKSIFVSYLIGFASAFGLLAVSNQLALLYYGDEFAVCGEIIAMMSPLIPMIGIGEALRIQFIYPLKMDMTMVKVLVLNAVVNLLLSTMLIPSLGITGAVIGTLAAQMTGLVIEIFIVRKYMSMKWMLLECLPFVIIGGVMLITVKLMSRFLGAGWLSLGIQVLTGAVVYCSLVFVYMYCFKRKLLKIEIRGIKNKMMKTK